MLLPEVDFEIVGPARSDDEAVRLAAVHSPDIVLVDLSHADGKGLRIVESLHVAHPNLPIVALTPGSFHDDYERAALEAGAATCLEKSELAVTLLPLMGQFIPARAQLSGPLLSRERWIGHLQRVQRGAVRVRTTISGLQRLPYYLVYMGLGLVGGAMGVALAIWLAILVQSMLPPTSSFSPGPLPLIITAILMSVGASWLLSQVATWLSPRFFPSLGGQALQIILVSSTSASLLQTLLFTRGW
jgi:CheY-like chemotaxis protein